MSVTQTTTTHTNQTKGNKLETAKAIKPTVQLAPTEYKLDKRTRDGKQLGTLMMEDNCTTSLVQFVRTGGTLLTIAVLSKWEKPLLKSMSDDINNHPLHEGKKRDVIVTESMMGEYSTLPIYIDFSVRDEEGNWTDHFFFNNNYMGTGIEDVNWHTPDVDRDTLRQAQGIAVSALQVEALRMEWLALNSKAESQKVDLQMRAEADAAFVMPYRERHAIKRAADMIEQIEARWEKRPITKDTRPYELVERAEEAYTLQACQIICANVGKWNADRKCHLINFEKKKYEMVTLEEVITSLYINWLSNLYTSELPLAQTALKSLITKIA